MHGALPTKQGLYDPSHEHDACGVGFIVHIKGQKNHDIVTQGLEILRNLTHRGAVGADPLAGDGAGILIQTPDVLLREECARAGMTLPALGEYGVGMLFLPRQADTRRACEDIITQVVTAEGQTILGWRDVPTNNQGLSEGVKSVEPVIKQVFVGKGQSDLDQDAFERKLFVIRKVIEHTVQRQLNIGYVDFYIPSFSSRTLLYKGMLLADQVGRYYPDLQDNRMITALALVLAYTK